MHDLIRRPLRFPAFVLALSIVPAMAQDPGAVSTAGSVDVSRLAPRRANQTGLPLREVRAVNGNPPSAAPSSLENGTPEISLNELFQNPVGPRGLEYSDKARKLNGSRGLDATAGRHNP